MAPIVKNIKTPCNMHIDIRHLNKKTKNEEANGKVAYITLITSELLK